MSRGQTPSCNFPNLTQRVKTAATGTEAKTDVYTWDHRNRLTSIVTTDADANLVQTVVYTYDLFNRRIGKDVTDADNDPVLSERYVYDGANIVLVLDGGGGVQHRILQGPGIDHALADEDASGNVQWFLTDHLGSVRDVVQLVSGTAQVVSHVDYDSFGNITNTPPETPRFAFAGRELDGESGLYYNRLRYYDAGTGRFLSEDPSRFAAGDTNLYRYVNNSPTGSRDPTGLCSERGQLGRASDWAISLPDYAWDATTYYIGKLWAYIDGYFFKTPGPDSLDHPKEFGTGALLGLASDWLSRWASNTVRDAAAQHAADKGHFFDAGEARTKMDSTIEGGSAFPSTDAATPGRCMWTKGNTVAIVDGEGSGTVYVSDNVAKDVADWVATERGGIWP